LQFERGAGVGKAFAAAALAEEGAQAGEAPAHGGGAELAAAEHVGEVVRECERRNLGGGDAGTDEFAQIGQIVGIGAHGVVGQLPFDGALTQEITDAGTEMHGGTLRR
jgi:hypothetical protein